MTFVVPVALLVLVLLVILAVSALSAPGGTVLVGGVPVEVTQGPAWLAALLYSPPWWAPPAVIAAALLVVGVAYVGYRRHGIDPEVKAEMLGNLLVVGLMGGCTAALASTGAFPYSVDVLGGSAVGFVLALAVQERLGL